MKCNWQKILFPFWNPNKCYKIHRQPIAFSSWFRVLCTLERPCTINAITFDCNCYHICCERKYISFLEASWFGRSFCWYRSCNYNYLATYNYDSVEIYNLLDKESTRYCISLDNKYRLKLTRSVSSTLVYIIFITFFSKSENKMTLLCDQVKQRNIIWWTKKYLNHCLLI